MEAIGCEAGIVVADVIWFPLLLKKKESLCCCVASASVNFVFQFAEENNATTAKLLWTFRTLSPVTCLLCADASLVTFHKDLSVLFLAFNEEFNALLNQTGFLQAEKTDPLMPSQSALRALTCQAVDSRIRHPLLAAEAPCQAVTSMLFLVKTKGALDLAARENATDSSTALQAESSQLPTDLQGAASQRASTLSLQEGEDELDGEDAETVNLETELVGIVAARPVAGLVLEALQTSAETYEIRIVTATRTGVVRSCTVQVPATSGLPAAPSTTRCVLVSHLQLPSSLSCLASGRHPALGTVILCGSENGVLRWLDLDATSLVKEIRVATDPVIALLACPEPQEAAEASLLWAALCGEGTLVFLRAADPRTLCSGGARDLLPLGIVSLAAALEGEQKDAGAEEAAGRRLYSEAAKRHVGKRLLLTRSLGWMQHASLLNAEPPPGSAAGWIVSCGSVLRAEAEEAPLNALFFICAPPAAFLPHNADLAEVCPLRAVRLACVPSALCVVGKALFVATAAGELLGFSGAQFVSELSHPRRGTSRPLADKPPAAPLFLVRVASSPLRTLAVATPPSSSASRRSSHPDSASAVAIATSMDGSVYGVQLPLLRPRKAAQFEESLSVAEPVAGEGDAPRPSRPSSSETESRHALPQVCCRVLWCRASRACLPESLTAAVGAALPASERNAEAVVFVASAGDDGLLLWRERGGGGASETHAETEPPSGAEAAQRTRGRQGGISFQSQIAATVEYSSDVGAAPAGDDVVKRPRTLGTPDASLEVSKPVKLPAAWEELWACGRNERLAREVQRDKEALQSEMQSLRKALRKLIEENEVRGSAEAVPREAFCLDADARRRIQETLEADLERFQKETELQRLVCSALRERLTEKIWKKMRRPGRALAAIADADSAVEFVRDYPLQATDATRLDEKLVFLRKLEKREEEWLRRAAAEDRALMRLRFDDAVATASTQNLEEEYITHARAGDGEQAPLVAAGVRGAEGDSLARCGGWLASAEKTFARVTSLRRLLYPPLEVLSTSRRRIQSCLLNRVAGALREAFNALFDAAVSDKRRTVEQINQKVKQAHAVAEELKCDPGVSFYAAPSCEDPEAILKVSAEEVRAELGYLPSWFSLEAQEEEAEQRESVVDEAAARALQQMMGGRLQNKTDTSTLEMQIEKERWMSSVKPEEMTEAQKKAVADYEEKVAQIQALQDAHRKKLEADLHRLKEEIRELKQTFGVRFQELQAKQRQFDAEILKQELYSMRMATWINSSSDRAESLERLLRRLHLHSRQSTKTRKALAEAAAKCQALEKQQHELLQEGKETVAALRASLLQAQLPPETYSAFMAIFRQRRMLSELPSSALSRTSASGDVTPRSAAERESLHGAEAASDALDVKCPEGGPESVFRNVLQARQEKSNAESRLAATVAAFDERRRYMSYLQQKQERESLVEAALVERIAEERQALEILELDVKLLMELKQGHVEVTSGTPVTTYEDACVVHKEAIDRCNNAILAIGKQKIHTLEMIKAFRRKIVLLDWEKRVLDAEARDVEERTRDVHMLRITKAIQKYLTSAAQQRGKRLQDEKEKNPKKKTSAKFATPDASRAELPLVPPPPAPDATQRNSPLDILDKKIRELQKEIKRKASENASLEQTAKELQQRALSKKLKLTRETLIPRTKEGSPDEGASEIPQRNSQFCGLQYVRRLENAARRYTDEIEELRDELKRLRARTIPMFEVEK
ncbi:hypothetical protein BESB_028080 [Besnoitia besnoiti]|uniref:Cilia- and flagella-associated protein 43 n=1 Tax=Besnoitia besnoiti TaxID=94643 RepID=A0A2A9M6W3_BESBE|nr:uncharacterized protein BESB_028080 [Besnoitia besnoiti]PFH31373.1 hypothetical protein BESB_028080 [Besnoitia besnoiti]